MTPEQRKTLPDALRHTLHGALQIRRLAPSTQPATIVESARGDGCYFVLGHFIDPETNDEVSTRQEVSPDGTVRALEFLT